MSGNAAPPVDSIDGSVNEIDTRSHNKTRSNNVTRSYAATSSGSVYVSGSLDRIGSIILIDNLNLNSFDPNPVPVAVNPSRAKRSEAPSERSERE